MPDLNGKIAEWRRQMLAAGIETPVPLNELESHLREAVEQQMRSGLGEQQAFEIALQRIGPASALKAEFEKVEDPRKARSRKQKIFFCNAAAVFYALIAIHTFFFRHDVSFSLAERVLGLAAVALTVSLLWSVGYFDRILPVLTNKRVRTGVGLACGVLGILYTLIFMNFILPAFDFTAGSVTVVCLLALLPMAIGGIISFGLEEATHRRTATAGCLGPPMHASHSNIEPAWATYLKATASLVPAVFLWAISVVFVMPKLKQICGSAVGVGDASFWKATHFNFGIMSLFQEYGIFIAGAIILMLILLEWRSSKWPRYRRAAVGAGALLLNSVVLISIFMMVVTATVAASVLFHPPK
jgi:hypothetical protein